MVTETAFLSTYILLGLTVIVSLQGFNNRDFMERFLFSPYAVKHSGEWWRFFTHAFLHGDYMHLFFNGFVLLNFGPWIETYFVLQFGVPLGEFYFWLFCISGMFGSSLISFYRHADNVHYRSLGISGVTSGILFAFILLNPLATLSAMLIPIPMPAWLFGIIYLGFEIYADRNRKTNIAHDAHIAGAIFGILFIFLTNIDGVVKLYNTLFS